MSQMIFINLPVADVAASRAFFTALGYSINEQFSDDHTACVVISEQIYSMIMTHERFAEFTPKSITDARTSTEVLNALSADSREAVDAIVERALASGATELREPTDEGNMYGRAFSDLDGHVWEHMWMDLSAAG